MNMIGGFTPPTSGEVYLDGVPITGLAPYKRDLGMMFQGYALFPHLTVFENVAFPLRARGTNNRELRNRVECILETVELSVLAHRLPHELSGGQQQRTALARALVFGPKLLLMDEPLAALDRRLRERMQSEIRMIQRRLAITVLYITHDQQEAMILADKVVIINQGQVEQVGEPIDVYRQPRTRFVSEFLGESNILDVTVESIEKRNSVPNLDGALYSGDYGCTDDHRCTRGYSHTTRARSFFVRRYHRNQPAGWPHRRYRRYRIHAPLSGYFIRNRK